MIDPKPTSTWDRPPMPTRAEERHEEMSFGWQVFCVVCLYLVLFCSAMAIWESVR